MALLKRAAAPTFAQPAWRVWSRAAPRLQARRPHARFLTTESQAAVDSALDVEAKKQRHQAVEALALDEQIEEAKVNHVRFDNLTRSLGTAASRRGLGRVLAGGCLGALFGTLGAPDVQSKKKRKKQKSRRNAFGCVDTRQPCAGRNRSCCSGICKGKKPRKGKKDTSRCVAHNAGVCTASTDSCAVGVSVPCNPSNPSCFCVATTGKAGFCGAFTGGPAGHCRVCRKDTDCEAEFGPGAACIVLGGVCTGLCLNTGTTACAPPCA
jgi:hypothetical protein